MPRRIRPHKIILVELACPGGLSPMTRSLGLTVSDLAESTRERRAELAASWTTPSARAMISAVCAGNDDGASLRRSVIVMIVAENAHLFPAGFTENIDLSARELSLAAA